MPWKDVCRRGRSVGGKVRQDDVRLAPGEKISDHNAGGSSPGIEKFVSEVVRLTPTPNFPSKPFDFPVSCKVETYPGRGNADVHFEGRAADVYLLVSDAVQKRAGEWLFDWCVANCVKYQIQGVIYDHRQWFSEKPEVTRAGGRPIPYGGTDHWNHVHVELNCDGAALTPTVMATAAVAALLDGSWNVTIGSWSGIFVFDALGGVYWANDSSSARHRGQWKTTGSSVEWKFSSDPGDFRKFSVSLPLDSKGTSGDILPEGQGSFRMSKQ